MNLRVWRKRSLKYVCPVCFGVNPIVTTLIDRDGKIRAVDVPCGYCGRRNGESPVRVTL